MQKAVSSQVAYLSGTVSRSGTIRYWCHLRDLVIPAKAGIYSANLWKCTVARLDSRFRGNDWRIEGIPIPNDTSTDYPQGLTPGCLSFYARGGTENLGGQEKAAAKTCFGLVIV